MEINLFVAGAKVSVASTTSSWAGALLHQKYGNIHRICDKDYPFLLRQVGVLMKSCRILTAIVPNSIGGNLADHLGREENPHSPQ
jgi:hypothetical protein